MKDHPEFNEFATCHRCGFKKYCKLEGRNFVCYSCSEGNYNGLKAKGLTKGR